MSAQALAALGPPARTNGAGVARWAYSRGLGAARRRAHQECPEIDPSTRSCPRPGGTARLDFSNTPGTTPAPPAPGRPDRMPANGTTAGSSAEPLSPPVARPAALDRLLGIAGEPDLHRGAGL